MMFKIDDLIYFVFAMVIIAVVLYIGFAFGRISDNEKKKENSNIFKKTLSLARKIDTS